MEDNVETNNNQGSNDKNDDGVQIVDSDEEVLFSPKDVLRCVNSLVWTFFQFRETKDGPNRNSVQCNFCQKNIPYNTLTSNMSWHLTSHHKKKYDEAVAAKEKNNPSSTSSQSSIKGYAVKKTSSVVKWKTSSQNYKTATRLIAKWVCRNSRPLSIVEDEGFRELINFLAPEYEVPTHTTISANISSYYEEEKKKLRDELENIEFCSVTTDGGTSSNAISYLDVNVHYIDQEFNLKSTVLGIRENKEEHTAENYREATNDILEEFGVLNKVVQFTTDNEPKMF